MARASLLVVLAVLAAGILVVAIRRHTHGWSRRRHDRLTARTRPLLLAVLTEDEADPTAMAALAELPQAQWRASESTIIGLLGKVRGGARESLSELLLRRGTLRRAEAGTRSLSVVRRCRAAEMLGAARQPSGCPALLRLLDDHSPEVRRVAARALGRIGAADAVRPLLATTAGPRSLPARDIAAALTLLEPAATEVIIDVARGTDDPRVLAIASEALGLRGAVPATGLLIELLESGPDDQVRLPAARALGRIASPAASESLGSALESASGELRAVVARALGQLGARDNVTRLVGCLGDPSHRVAANAAESLTALGEPGLEALRSLERSGRPRETGYAREALSLHAIGRRAVSRQGA